MGAFTIGELARRTGASRDTLRFYERLGLLPAPARTASGYRLFDEDDARRVLFIREARAIGLSLDGIRELLSVRALRTPGECRRVAEHLARRIREIDEKIRELETFRRRLEEGRKLCETTGGRSCPLVLDLLSKVSAGRPPGARGRPGPRGL